MKSISIRLKSLFRSASLAGLVAVLCLAVTILPVVGCSAADVQKTVALIQAELPTAISLVSALAPLVLSIAGAQNGTDVNNAVNTVTAKLTDLQVLCQQYTANPSNDTFSSIVNLVDQLVTTGDTALLDITNVKNAQSQQQAAIILGSLSAALHIIDGYVQAVQTTKEVKATAASRAVKLRAVHAYWSAKDKKDIETAFSADFDTIYGHEVALGF